MKEHPILFNTEMVRAILDGQKTQTRRVVKPQPEAIDVNKKITVPYGGSGEFLLENLKCPYGVVGDRLWVKETFFISDGQGVIYRADNNKLKFLDDWKPSIHMPRSASRILLEITDIRVERLQEISRVDAKAEGFLPSINGLERFEGKSYGNAQLAFRDCWDSIYTKQGLDWDANPWVWVVSFKVIKIG